MQKEIYNENTVIYTFEDRSDFFCHFHSVQDIIKDSIDTFEEQYVGQQFALIACQKEDILYYIVSFGKHAQDCLELISLSQELAKFIQKAATYWKKSGVKDIAERLEQTSEFAGLVFDMMDLDSGKALLNADNIFMDGLDSVLQDKALCDSVPEADRQTVMEYINHGLICCEGYDDTNDMSDEIYHIKNQKKTDLKYFSGMIGDIFDLSRKNNIHGDLYKKDDKYIFASPDEWLCQEWLEPWYGDIRQAVQIGRL